MSTAERAKSGDKDVRAGGSIPISDVQDHRRHPRGYSDSCKTTGPKSITEDSTSEQNFC
jgi:hypothetical protein